MTPEYTFYGLNIPELVFFGILIYLAALVLVIIFVRCIQSRAFCPYSGESLHFTYLNSCQNCPSCSLRQSAKSVFCCRRHHSVYESNVCENLPKCKIACFKPDWKYLRCCCCEFFVDEEEDKVSPQKSNIDEVIGV